MICYRAAEGDAVARRRRGPAVLWTVIFLVGLCASAKAAQPQQLYGSKHLFSAPVPESWAMAVTVLNTAKVAVPVSIYLCFLSGPCSRLDDPMDPVLHPLHPGHSAYVQENFGDFPESYYVKLFYSGPSGAIQAVIQFLDQETKIPLVLPVH
jgi:hypothetical protein